VVECSRLSPSAGSVTAEKLRVTLRSLTGEYAPHLNIIMFKGRFDAAETLGGTETNTQRTGLQRKKISFVEQRRGFCMEVGKI
jgi:hypothetical protein